MIDTRIYGCLSGGLDFMFRGKSLEFYELMTINL